MSKKKFGERRGKIFLETNNNTIMHRAKNDIEKLFFFYQVCVYAYNVADHKDEVPPLKFPLSKEKVNLPLSFHLL